MKVFLTEIFWHIFARISRKSVFEFLTTKWSKLAPFDAQRTYLGALGLIISIQIRNQKSDFRYLQMYHLIILKTDIF